MNEDEMKEMRAIIDEYFEKVEGHEELIRKTPGYVELWAKDLDMQVSNLYLAVGALSCNQFYASQAYEHLRALSDRIKARRREVRNVA